MFTCPSSPSDCELSLRSHRRGHPAGHSGAVFVLSPPSTPGASEAASRRRLFADEEAESRRSQATSPRPPREETTTRRPRVGSPTPRQLLPPSHLGMRLLSSARHVSTPGSTSRKCRGRQPPKPLGREHTEEHLSRASRAETAPTKAARGQSLKCGHSKAR